MTLMNRIYRGFHRYNNRFLPSPENGNGEIAVMVHGLIRRGRNMYWLGKRVNRAGYSVYLYDYATTTKSVAAHGKDFLDFMLRIAADNPGCKINIVTHSMGGIITRELLGHLPCESVDDGTLCAARIHRIVMLAPPNHGSDAARRATRFLPFTRRWIKPLAELSSSPDAYIHQVPIPENYDIGIIAGRFDFEVAQEYTLLYGMKDHIVVNSDHSFMMYLPHVARLTVKYLAEGHF